MSLLSEIMGEAQGVINEILGSPCTLTNSATEEQTEGIPVVIRSNVEYYKAGLFAGLVTTGVIPKAGVSAMIGDTLLDTETGIEYSLDGIKSETSSKIEFILSDA